MKEKKKGGFLSEISKLHYFKLVYRSGLFLWALVMYILSWVKVDDELQAVMDRWPGLLAAIWLVYAGEMVLRFFPSKWESMGCQKQFTCNYQPKAGGRVEQIPWNTPGTVAVAAAWIALNSTIGLLYYLKIFDQGIMLLICLAYAVCDMICILFFCPFQTWFMKNKCCANCRIYNWDYAMMFTPLLFVPHWYTWSLLGLGLGLLLAWEIRLHKYPERFFECTNEKLSCANCPEKLCHHKKQLRQLWKTLAESKYNPLK